MKIIALVENTPSVPGCQSAHGLSLWIETGSHRLLMDAGPSDLLTANAQALGIDLTQAELLVLSHGHYDHSDGIPAFAALAPNVPIYLRRSALEAYYSFSAPDAAPRYIGVHPELRRLPQLCLVDGETELAPGIKLFGHITGRRLWPESNLRLSIRQDQAFFQDSFDHEQCLVVLENNKTILFSGCAHNGILNILDRYASLYGGAPDVVVSGFHLKKTGAYTASEKETICATARELQKWPSLFCTCHCTGLTAFQMMKEIMGDQLLYLACGETLAL